MFKRHKILSFLFLLLLIFSMFYFYMYKSISEQFQTQNSINPKATAYFTHAMTISTINNATINQIIPHNSIFMRPIFNLQKFIFEKGQKYLAKDNAEDSMWWGYIFGYYYGINYNDNVNIKIDFTQMNFSERNAILYQLYDNIIRIIQIGIKGINFDNQVNPMLFSYIENYSANNYNAKNEEIYDNFKIYLQNNKKEISNYSVLKLTLLIKILEKYFNETTQLAFDCENKYITDYIELCYEIFSNFDNIGKKLQPYTIRLMQYKDYNFLDNQLHKCFQYEEQILKIKNLINEK